MHIRNKKNGFTLVELIIALLILSVVMVLCGSGFRFGTRVWDAVDTQSVQLDTLQAVQSFLRKSISHALVYNQALEDISEEQEIYFIGTDKKLKFISYSPQFGVDDFLYKYELYLKPKQDALTLHYQPHNSNQRKNREESESTILQGVKDISIKYFSGYESDESENGWLSKWEDEFSLPLLVKINVLFEDNKNNWPELVIQMRHGPYVLR